MGEECDLLRARRCREVMVMELLGGDLCECGIAEQMRINNGPMKKAGVWVGRKSAHNPPVEGKWNAQRLKPCE